jgi:uncharacterized peroxidase-related enzyme
MPHIQLPPGIPGIRAALQFRPETAAPLLQLAEVLLRAPHTLSTAEREMLAARVSHLNGCYFCEASHRAAAAHQFGGNYAAVDAVIADPERAPITAKFRALLAIAGEVVKGGLHVTATHVQVAREAGATDVEIHDTVLIAAAFCMFNRYVDGLATETPTNEDAYEQMGQRMAHIGYSRRPPTNA